MLNEPITLVRHKLDDHYWSENYASWWSDGYESRAEMTRHHADVCTPFWVLGESHTDVMGKQWRAQTYCVIDDFGNLKEVPYEQPI
ncbi:hypothetical protein ACFIQF_24580 [Comamonas sp. J-3]|uniref:hypothetical protein n=1 Tax=Comamonas trifloxystrobinivorans TaxID=3350256 RepID=UPI00372B62B6